MGRNQRERERAKSTIRTPLQSFIVYVINLQSFKYSKQYNTQEFGYLPETCNNFRTGSKANSYQIDR